MSLVRFGVRFAVLFEDHRLLVKLALPRSSALALTERQLHQQEQQDPVQ